MLRGLRRFQWLWFIYKPVPLSWAYLNLNLHQAGLVEVYISAKLSSPTPPLYQPVCKFKNVFFSNVVSRNFLNHWWNQLVGSCVHLDPIDWVYVPKELILIHFVQFPAMLPEMISLQHSMSCFNPDRKLQIYGFVNIPLITYYLIWLICRFNSSQIDQS